MINKKSGDYDHVVGLQPFPLSAEEWRCVRAQLQLTEKQAKVAALVLQAACDKKVAYELNLGLPTVRTHLRRIYEKAGVQDRTELIIRIFNIARDNEK
jgi:DNA-binding NarL/FixJ family response regulator